jgi:hypothetical protein
MKYHNFILIILCFFEAKTYADSDWYDKCFKNTDVVCRMDDETLNAYVDWLYSTDPGHYKYSLLDIDSAMLAYIFSSDSLFEVIVSEIDKLPPKDSTTYYLTNGLRECSIIAFPKTLLKYLSKKEQGQIQERFGRNKFFHISDDISYTACYIGTDCAEEICATDILTNYSPYIFPETIILSEHRVGICVSPIIANACALHFSSETSSDGEIVILINSTIYHIAKRKDGSTVLRKVD